jgi:hypothetical protein
MNLKDNYFLFTNWFRKQRYYVHFVLYIFHPAQNSELEERLYKNITELKKKPTDNQMLLLIINETTVEFVIDG